jgi:hypothetical protein
MPSNGRLDRDSDLENIRPGNYSNLQGMDFADGDVPQLTTQKGNVFQIDLGEASLQQQKTRININDVTVPLVVTLKDINGNIKGSSPLGTTGSIAAVKTDIINYLSSLSFGVQFESTGAEPYLDVTINFSYSDYVLEITGCSTDILKEAISNTGVGRFIPIGSYDLLDSVFYWSTTQRNLPQRLSNVSDVYPANGSFVGITCIGHGLQTFDSVAIGAVNGVPQANGIWTVTVIDADNFYLNTSFFTGAYTGGGTVYKDIYGYGAIGVVVEDFLTDSFDYTPLLRSKALNFFTKKQIYTPQVQVSGELYQMYYTDNFNVPRVTYYRGEFIPDGAIRVLNPTFGQYAYATLKAETSRQINFTGYDLQYETQVQTGGSISAGNARYAIRFLTESLTASELSPLTGPIPVYSPQYVNDDSVIFGNPSTVSTGKINRVRLSGITPGVFKFVELIYFQYSGEATTVTTLSYVIRREPLSEDQTEIVLEHNGNELSIALFDTQLANEVQPDIIRSTDNVIIDNRLVDGGVTTGKQIDCRDWVSTFKYSLKKFPLFGSFGAETFNEFYSPEAVVNRVGYSAFEWERFYAVPVLKSGKSLNAFFMFDVRFVSQTDYTNNPDFQFLSTNGTDRRDFNGDEFTNYDLGTGDNIFYQLYLEVKNIDWNYQIDGVPVRDIFEEVRFYRAETIHEVLHTGVLNMAQDNTAPSDGSNTVLGDFPFSVIRGVESIPDGPIDVLYGPYSPPYGKRNYGSFYSPDIFLGTQPFSFIQGDQVLTFGSQETVFVQAVADSFPEESYWRIFNSVGVSNSASFYDIELADIVTTGSQKEIESGIIYSKEQRRMDNPIPIAIPNFFGINQGSPVLKFTTNVSPSGANPNNGLYQAIYFRPRTDKYGSITQANVTLYCGAKSIVNQSSSLIFGGNTFTQQTWLKTYYRQTLEPSVEGRAGGCSFVSQNRGNSNLRLWDSTLTNNIVFPVSTQSAVTWLENDPDNLDQLESNPAYKVLNQVQAQAVYDPENQDTGEYLSRKYWSQFKPNNSAVDFFRIILPLDFQDNPEIQGAIKRLVNLNNRLFTIQERGFTLEYFNNQGQLVSQDAGQILIGDGSVLSRIGNNLSLFGLKQSGAFVRGKSQSGKDTAMWINTTFTNVLRFGDDGIKNVSLRDLNRTFFNRYLKWANIADVPADGYGISGAWDNDNSNYIFTVKAWKPFKKWDANVTYLGGDGTIFGEIEQGVPQIWIANQASRGVEPNDGISQWRRADILDPLFYNCYTFAYSEIKNGFTFYPYFLPNFYAQWKGKYLTANPNLESIDKSKIYLHNEGLPNQFYGVNYPGGVIELTMNWQPNMNKKVLALMINSNIKPERVDIESLFRNEPDGERIKKSFLVTSDFETREGYQYSTIKLELDENGRNDRNTSMMEGVWTKFRIQFPAGVTAKLNDCIVLISDSLRTFNPIN